MAIILRYRRCTLNRALVPAMVVLTASNSLLSTPYVG